MIKEQDKLPRYKRILYFFPVQLLLLHFKRNYVVLISWAILFGYTTGLIGQKYGINYLFLAPEYLGEISPLSFAILGFSFGGFVMAFNIYSYVMHVKKFKFIATVARPFYKFCINNSIIPLIFIVTFIGYSVQFQHKDELISTVQSILNIGAFILGAIVFFMLSLFYFFKTNKDFVKLNGVIEEEHLNTDYHKHKRWFDAFLQSHEWTVRSYVSSFSGLKMARDAKHYDDGLITKVMLQNRVNATYFEIITIITFILLGTFKEYDWIRIPAGASIMLLFTIMLMVVSILYAWLKGWTALVLTVLIIGLNWGSNQTDLLRFKSYAYGLDYTSEHAIYNVDDINNRYAKSTLETDYQNGIGMLNNWRTKQTSDKSPFILINCSGGGLRAAVWAFQVLQELDKASDGSFFKQSVLITGSSGGMIGAAYYRELALQDHQNGTQKRFSNVYKELLSQDMLNSISINIATSDPFPRIQTFTDGDFAYTKDRGYIFEKNLNENTEFLLSKRLIEYQLPEKQADIPMMILAPTIVNDGKRLLISPQFISYLTHDTLNRQDENIEFLRIFDKQNAEELRMTSALRMNATFPYVLPMVTLPSNPSLEVMDAGLRDNYGVKDAVKFASVFEPWIKTHTSEIVFIQIRDRQRNDNVRHEPAGSLLHRLFTPFSNVYGNILKTQDYTNDQLLESFRKQTSHPVKVYSFNLMDNRNENISLSWHLTALEKKKITQALSNKKNADVMHDVLKVVAQE